MFLKRSMQDDYKKVDWKAEFGRLLRFSPQAWGRKGRRERALYGTVLAAHGSSLHDNLY